MNLRFDHPMLLLIALAAVPLVLIGWRAMAGMHPVRRFTALGLRCALMFALAIILAQPYTVQKHDQLTVIGLLDVSGSVRQFAQLPQLDELNQRSNIAYLREWFRKATDTRAEDDRFGLVVFDGQAMVISAPTRDDYVDDNLDVTTIDGTNIADAIRLGLALFPADTAKRLVLVTDGNQTAGDALEAARLAAGTSAGGSIDMETIAPENLSSVPIDILPVAYEVDRDVQVARVEAPPNAQPGQTVTVRIIVEATRDTTGRLTLRHEDRIVDINGTEQGTSRLFTAPAGQSVHLARVELGDTPVNRFTAVFEPLDPANDRLAQNNRAEAFTATPTKGSVVVVDSSLKDQSNLLVAILESADIPVSRIAPAQLPANLLSLQRFDLIVLDDVSAYELSPQHHDMLSRYVNDLGGGLIMVGGEHSFGAGGWNGTKVEDVLPLELDPSQELRLPTAAVVLVLDKSGSMNENVAGARASQQEVANEGAARAIESLQRETLVGVVTFDLMAHTHIPLQRNDNPKELADRVRGITSSGGTNIAPALRKAHMMLRESDVQRKHVVCLSDGRSPNDELDEIVKAMVEDDITVTTIAVGDGADRDTMLRLAQAGGGEFYPVRNPRMLPVILVDSVQVVNRPLIKEGRFTPVVQPTASTLTLGMQEAPPLEGLVITVPKKDPLVSVELTHPEGEPLLATWQAGLGRVAAFTSDIGGEWSARWDDWPEAATFWTQLVRTISRPVNDQETELVTTIQDDELRISLRLANPETADSSFMIVDGTVYDPHGRATPIRLRQTAPGIFETVMPAQDAGTYIVALAPRSNNRRLAPVISGASKSTSPEFRRYSSNLSLLESIIELTGGRLLDIAEPTAVNLYDRSDMPVSVSFLPAWRIILGIVFAVLLLDVACRRIAWEPATVRRAVAAARARLHFGQARTAEAAATLAGLRRVSESFDERIDSDAEGIERLQGTGRIAPRPPRAFAADVDEDRRNAALQTLLGRRKTTPPAAAKPADAQDGSPPEAEAETAESNAGSTETTSSLLAAKRRATEKYRDPTAHDRP